MSTEERLAQIRARCEAATPGPWAVHKILGEGSYTSRSVYPVVSLMPATGNVWVDADFIEHAHDDISYLLSELDRLTAERDGEQAHLRDAVVEAALAERRAQLCYDPMDYRWLHGGLWDADIERAYDNASDALRVACDALLAFLGEGKHA